MQESSRPAAKEPWRAWLTPRRGEFRAGNGEPVRIPDPDRKFVAITRRDHVVKRHELSSPEHVFPDALQRGRTVGQAIRQAPGAADVGTDGLPVSIRDWFRAWAAAATFHAVKLP